MWCWPSVWRRAITSTDWDLLLICPLGIKTFQLNFNQNVVCKMSQILFMSQYVIRTKCRTACVMVIARAQRSRGTSPNILEKTRKQWNDYSHILHCITLNTEHIKKYTCGSHFNGLWCGLQLVGLLITCLGNPRLTHCSQGSDTEALRIIKSYTSANDYCLYIYIYLNIPWYMDTSFLFALFSGLK